MNVSTYEYRNQMYTDNRMPLPQIGENQTDNQIPGMIDHSVFGNRLYQHVDGTIRLQEKPVGVIIGEKILRPIIDLICDLVCNLFHLIKSVFSFLNDLLPKNVFVFPGASATPVSPVVPANPHTTYQNVPQALQHCVSGELEKTGQVVRDSIGGKDPSVLPHVAPVLDVALEGCFKVANYANSKEIHKLDRDTYKEEQDKMNKALKNCNAENGKSSCIIRPQVEQPPRMFIIPTSQRMQSGEIFERQEWQTTEGCLYWEVKILGYIYNSFYAKGNYNYDEKNWECSVPGQIEIMKNIKLLNDRGL